MHKPLCQATYSLNFTSGMGHSDGEGIEWPWAHLGPVVTREMGTGSQHDPLDDHLGHWNWQKLVGLAKLLKKQLRMAVTEQKAQAAALVEFSDAQAEYVPEWESWIRDWDAKHMDKNLYILPHSSISEKQVHLQLLQEEEAVARAGEPALHNVSPVGFVVASLEIR